jgi:uncharacterized protein (TIGR03083 family)
LVESIQGAVITVAAPAENAGLFLAAAQTMVEALANPTIAQRWEEPSALEGYTIGGLAAHTARSIRTVLIYLDGPAPDDPGITPADYFLHGLKDEDPLRSELHRGIRQRATDAAAAGPTTLVEAAGSDLSALAERLAATPDRTVEVFGGAAMALSDYLVTRLVELVVHLDDLAHSIGSDLPAPPDAAIDLTLATLFEIAVARNGTTLMMRALARVERISEFPRAF